MSGLNPPPESAEALPASSGRAAFRYPAFRYFQSARLLATLGYQMQGVAVGWQVYQLTDNPLHLGYVGLAQFLPAIGFALLTGHTADRFERRRILMICHGVLCACSATLAFVSLSHAPSVWTIYALLAGVGSARAFSGPAGQAMLPNLVPTEHFSNAVAWSSTIWHVATIAGPALGGFVYSAAGGATHVYVAAAALELGALLSLALMRLESTRRAPSPASWHELLAGLRYVRRHPLILGSISLDMFAVLFGGAVALLPVYARDILHVGPTGLGMLRSAPALGATLTAVLLAFRPLQRRAGAWLLGCVALFGVATVVFGISTSFWLSLVALLVTGASDMVSVYVRHTVVQLSTPDAMRGRVSAVNLVFIGASNELGEFESGVTAAWFGTVPAVVLGGLGTCAVVAAWALAFPGLRRVDRLDERSLAAATR